MKISEENARVIDAAAVIIGDRDCRDEMPAILASLEHVVATVLMVTMDSDRRKAVGMLNEGLVPGVEDRIARYSGQGTAP